MADIYSDAHAHENNRRHRHGDGNAATPNDHSSRDRHFDEHPQHVRR